MKGINSPKVTTAVDVLLGKAKLGDKIVVTGGGLVGSETALFLSEQNKRVTIVEMLPEIAGDVEPITRMTLLHMLRERNVELLVDKKVDEITDGGLIAVDKNWNRHTLEADNVVLALGMTPNSEVYGWVKEKVPDTYIIGDCYRARKIFDAVHEGFRIGFEI
jgi:pyruvate/2-oxoglutarate dehydrogenase complex dihydrolipoamide dehydrogenase (E3) component